PVAVAGFLHEREAGRDLHRKAEAGVDIGLPSLREGGGGEGEGKKEEKTVHGRSLVDGVLRGTDDGGRVIAWRFRTAAAPRARRVCRSVPQSGLDRFPAPPVWHEAEPGETMDITIRDAVEADLPGIM